ncbi:hypothetical protein P7C70_g3340, partial [Phenoliferia sp. Uapishka_3]
MKAAPWDTWERNPVPMNLSQGQNQDRKVNELEADSDMSTDHEFEYESDFNGFSPIDEQAQNGAHIFEFAPEFLETGHVPRTKPKIREVSGFTDSEYESDAPETHGLQTALITSQMEALKVAQDQPYRALLTANNDPSASGSKPYEPSHAWEEKRFAQEAWKSSTSPDELIDEPRHVALNFMQSVIPLYLEGEEKVTAFHPVTENVREEPHAQATTPPVPDTDMSSDDESDVDAIDPELQQAAKEVDALCDLPYHPGGSHAGFCLLERQRDRDEYWGWALSRNSIDKDLPFVVRDHKGLYNVRFNEQGECSEKDQNRIAHHKCSKHCLFSSRWALVAGIPIQGMAVLSPNDAFQHRISLSHTERTSDFEADADKFVAMGHPIKLGVDDLSDRLPITCDLVFDIKLHGKSGFKAFIDTGSDNSLIAPYPAREVRILKAHIRPYLTPKTLRLGTKGSHAMVNSYCYLEMELAGIEKLQRFDVTNVFTDCVIGRDVLRTHACSIEFGPDRLVARDLTGTAPPKKGKSSRESASANFGYMQDATNHDETEAPQVSARPHYQRPYDANTPIWDPRHLEKGAHRPVFTAKARKGNASGVDVDSDGYKPSEEEIMEFHTWCSNEFKDAFIADGDTLPLPPLRPVQHQILYIDESDPPRPRRNYKIPDKFMEKWNELHEKHIAAGIWIPMQTRNADPIMPVIKKDGKLRPTVDLRARNANTIKMSCPLLETDFSRNTLAAHKMHVELDVKGCFQQLRTHPSDVCKTVFSTIRGTYGTLTAQQGDPNSVVTQLAMLSYMFWDQIGKVVVNYADNLFVHANRWRELKLRTIEVLVRARLHRFCMNINSFKVCPKWVEVLGMRIRHGEIRMDEGKRDAIAMMNVPHDKKSLQRFIGSVEWLARFIPHLAEVASPLIKLTGNATWSWTTAQQLAFEEIKCIVEEDRRLTVIVDSELAPTFSTPVHMKEPPRAGQEIDNDEAGNYIFLQCDASASGTSATLTVGKNWWSAKTVMTHSRKLTGPQHNYRTHEQELLAVFEGFQKFEGQLLGRKVIVITNNVSLEAFLTGRNFTPRQARVYDYLSQFDFVVVVAS